MGHELGSSTRHHYYKPSTSNADLVGMSVDGKQDALAKHRVGNAAPRLQPFSQVEQKKIRQTPEALHAIAKREAAFAAWQDAEDSEKEDARLKYRSIRDKVLGFFKKEEQKLRIANAEASGEAQAMRTLQRMAPIDDQQQPAEAAPDPAVAQIESIIASHEALNENADRLCAIEESACALFDVESLDLTPLLVAAKDKLSFCESFALLNSTDTVDPARGAASCINCDLVFNTTKVDRNKDCQHVRTQADARRSRHFSTANTTTCSQAAPSAGVERAPSFRPELVTLSWRGASALCGVARRVIEAKPITHDLQIMIVGKNLADMLDQLNETGGRLMEDKGGGEMGPSEEEIRGVWEMVTARREHGGLVEMIVGKETINARDELKIYRRSPRYLGQAAPGHPLRLAVAPQELSPRHPRLCSPRAQLDARKPFTLITVSPLPSGFEQRLQLLNVLSHEPTSPSPLICALSFMTTVAISVATATGAHQEGGLVRRFGVFFHASPLSDRNIFFFMRGSTIRAVLLELERARPSVVVLQRGTSSCLFTTIYDTLASSLHRNCVSTHLDTLSHILNNEPRHHLHSCCCCLEGEGPLKAALLEGIHVAIQRVHFPSPVRIQLEDGMLAAQLQQAASAPSSQALQAAARSTDLEERLVGPIMSIVEDRIQQGRPTISFVYPSLEPS